MYISNNNLLLIILLTLTLIVIILIIKNMNNKDYYENELIESPYPFVNTIMNDFNKIYKKNISSAIGLINYQRNYY